MTKLSQREVDQIRLNVLTSLLISKVKRGDAEEEVFHLRFPENRTTRYVQRDGNPPSDTDRNLWERGIRLELDLGAISDDLRLSVHRLLNLYRNKKMPVTEMVDIRTHLMNKVASEMKRIMGAEFQGEPMTLEDLMMLERYEEAEVKRKLAHKGVKASKKIVSYPSHPKWVRSDRDVIS